MSCNNQYKKSCVRVYNNNTQAFVASGTQLNIEGTPVVNSGCSLTLNTTNIRINKSGLYHVSADVTFVPSAAGNVSIQFLRNGVVLPCAVAVETVVANNAYTKHIETDLEIVTCCVNQPLITLTISGVAGSVSHTCVGIVKLA